MEIGPGPLRDSLIDLAGRFDMEVLVVESENIEAETPGLTGSYTADAALRELLQGSGLSYRFLVAGMRFVVAPTDEISKYVDAQRELGTGSADKNGGNSPDNNVESGEVEPATGAPGDDEAFPVSGSGLLDPAVEEIVVTGSRIGKPTSDVSAPVAIIDGDYGRLRGFTNAFQLVSEHPAVVSASREDGSSSDPDLSGIQTVNLRGLNASSGNGRTLVLVNGRRHVAGFIGRSDVDVSTIPSSLVERVEIVTGGSSAVYGSEAIAGVVNYILKKDFEGLELSTHLSGAEAGDGETSQFSLTWGKNFGSSTNLSTAFEYSKTEPASALNRPYILDFPQQAAVIDLMTFSAMFVDVQDLRNGFLTDAGVPISPRLLSLTRSPGLSIYTDLLGTITGTPRTPLRFQNGGVVAFDQGTPVDPFFFPFTGQSTGGDGFPVPLFNTGPILVNESEKFILNLNAKHDISDDVSVFLETKFNTAEGAASSTNIRHQGAASATSPHWLRTGLDNPYLPAELAFIAPFLGDTEILVAREHDDLGRRSSDYHTEGWRTVIGIDGRFGEEAHWSLSYLYGESSRDTARTDYSLSRMVQAGDVIAGAGGSPECRDTSNGCVPINFFTADVGYTPAQLDFIAFYPASDSRITQSVFDATVAGSLWTLPGGAVRYSAGLEYREETARFDPNEVALRANAEALSIFGTREDPVEGDFNVWEVFGEVSLPLLRDKPWAKKLLLDLSARYGDYSTTGGAQSWKAGIVWAPIRDVQVRAATGASVRAPSIAELFPPSTSTSSVLDACTPLGLASAVNAANRESNCLAQGIDPNTQPAVPFFVNVAPNQNLDIEKAETTTAGISISPRFLQGLTLAVDYWKVDIENALTNLTSSGVMFSCYDVDPGSFPTQSCAQITRDPATNAITSVNAGFVNAEALNASGIDYQLTYTFAFTDLVNLSFNYTASQLSTFQQFIKGSGNPRGDQVGLAGRPRSQL